MSIDDPFTALKYILQSNSNITDLLGVYEGTSIPLIASGRLAEVEMNKNALVYYINNDDPNFNINDTLMTINCYAQDTNANTPDADRNSYLLARTVVKELKGLQTTAGGYPVTLSPVIRSTIPDPAIKEANTAVEVRLFNIGGAL